MGATPGNNFYLLRSKHGRNKIYASADELREACYEYFNTCDEHPWHKKEVLKGGEMAGEVVSTPIERPYTQTGLYIFLGINRQTWENYKKDYLAVIEEIEAIIYTQKFEGATVGTFNASIIARDLHLAEKVEGTNTNINYNTELSPEEIKRIDDTLESTV